MAAVSELDGEDPAAVVCDFEGFATSPPPTPHAGLSAPSPSPEKDKTSFEEQTTMGNTMLGSFCEGGSSASTRCSHSDGTFESSGDEHQQAEKGKQWWKCMGTASGEDAVNDTLDAHDQMGTSISTWVTVQDLEGRIHPRPSSLRHGAGDMKLLMGNCYSSKATGAVARRVAKACQKHVSWQ